MVGYKYSHNAASNGRAFQGTGVDSNLIPGGGTSLGGAEATAFTKDALAEESSLLEVCRERVSSSSKAGTGTSGDIGSSVTTGIDIRSERKEVEEGEEGAEVNENDEGVNEVGRDGERPPNSCRSSWDGRLFEVSNKLSTTRFVLLFRVLGPIGAVLGRLRRVLARNELRMVASDVDILNQVGCR